MPQRPTRHRAQLHGPAKRQGRDQAGAGQCAGQHARAIAGHGQAHGIGTHAQVVDGIGHKGGLQYEPGQVKHGAGQQQRHQQGMLADKAHTFHYLCQQMALWPAAFW